MYLNKFLPLFFLNVVFLACEPEPKTPVYEKQDLIGQWELTEAWRNNRKTETLVGTYYNFDDNGHMSTNFNLDMQESSYEYEFDGRQITQKGEEETVYHIDSLTSSTLIFSTTFHNFPFKLALTKKLESEDEPTSEM